MSEQPKGNVCIDLGPRLSQFLRAMGPGEDAVGHFRSARVEFLKGVRSILDKQIENLNADQSRGAKVTVE